MDKLKIADPSFLPAKPVIDRQPQPYLPPDKPKRKKLRPQDLGDLDMDNLEEEISLLGFDLDAVPMNPASTPGPNRKYSGFELEIFRTREEAKKMKEPMYDEDGCPILPDGSNRLFTIQELIYLSRQQQAKLCQDKPKKRRDPKKMKLRKNPPPRKVDIDAMFREEIKRREKLEEYN